MFSTGSYGWCFKAARGLPILILSGFIKRNTMVLLRRLSYGPERAINYI